MKAAVPSCYGCPAVFAGYEMAKVTLAQKTPSYNMGDGRTARDEGMCARGGTGGMSGTGHSQNESRPLSLTPLGTAVSPLPAGASGQGGTQRSCGNRSSVDVLPPPHSSRAPASISSLGPDRPCCCRSMQINAKLIRVINSAVPQRSYRQGFR